MTIEAYGSKGCVAGLQRAAVGGSVTVVRFVEHAEKAWGRGERFPPVYAVVARLGSWSGGCDAAGLRWLPSQQDLEALRYAGLTYTELGRELGVGTQQAWLAMRDSVADAPVDGPGRFAARWGRAVEVEFAELRNARMVAEALGVSDRLVRRHLQLGGLAHLEVSSAQGPRPAWSVEDMVGLLRQFVAEAGEPATLGRLASWADATGRRVPSYRTWIVRFGSWREACVAAGVPSGEPTRTFNGSGAVDARACVDAVREYLRLCMAEGSRPTLTGYEAVSSERGWPCRNTVVLRLGSWREAVSVAGELIDA